MFKLNQEQKLSESVRGLFDGIPYEVREPSGDWSKWFGKYDNQKWDKWDSNSCWCLSAVNCVEDQLEWLWKNNMFSEESKLFFVKNGYIDSDSDFSCSERFLEIHGGYFDNGGPSKEAWRLMQKYGMIPRVMLDYTHERAKSFKTKEAFNDDFFNRKYITDDMLKLGQEFKTHVDIAVQNIGRLWHTPSLELIKAALKQSPLQISVPVPIKTSAWNKETVVYDGRRSMNHAVELYAIDEKNNYKIFDQYMPNLKTLTSDYYIPQIHQGVVYAVKPVTVNSIKQETDYWTKFWKSVHDWYNGIFNPFPVGKK